MVVVERHNTTQHNTRQHKKKSTNPLLLAKILLCKLVRVEGVEVGDNLACKRLVELKHVNVVQGEAGLLEDLVCCIRGAQQQLLLGVLNSSRHTHTHTYATQRCKDGCLRGDMGKEMARVSFTHLSLSTSTSTSLDLFYTRVVHAQSHTHLGNKDKVPEVSEGLLAESLCLLGGHQQTRAGTCGWGSKEGGGASAWRVGSGWS